MTLNNNLAMFVKGYQHYGLKLKHHVANYISVCFISQCYLLKHEMKCLNTTEGRELCLVPGEHS